MGLFVCINWSAVFSSSFVIVTAFAKCLPVFFVPEKSIVTSMRNLMIHNRCWFVSVILEAFNTQRMFLQIQFRQSLPSASVSSLCCTRSFVSVCRTVFFTVHLSCLNKVRTHRILAWVLWLMRHGNSFLYQSDDCDIIVLLSFVIPSHHSCGLPRPHRLLLIFKGGLQKRTLIQP